MALMLTTLSLFDNYHCEVFYWLEFFFCWLSQKLRQRRVWKAFKTSDSSAAETQQTDLQLLKCSNTEFEAVVYTMENALGKNCQHFH